MADTEQTIALNKVGSVLHSVSYEECQKVYDKWSETYDADLHNLGYKTCVETGLLALNYLNQNSVVLDIGGGTGWIGQCLRNHNFEGSIDVLDANLKLLVIGEKKGLNYRNIFCHSVAEDGRLPLKEKEYDVVISVGSFLPNHIPATALKGIVNVVKKDGMLLVSVRGSTTEGYKTVFDQVVQELQKSGKIKLLETKECEHFSNVKETIMSVIYVMKILC